eukprot:4346670-Pleurochrysis_carterae.AAC.3
MHISTHYTIACGWGAEAGVGAGRIYCALALSRWLCQAVSDMRATGSRTWGAERSRFTSMQSARVQNGKEVKNELRQTWPRAYTLNDIRLRLHAGQKEQRAAMVSNITLRKEGHKGKYFVPRAKLVSVAISIGYHYTVDCVMGFKR